MRLISYLVGCLPKAAAVLLAMVLLATGLPSTAQAEPDGLAAYRAYALAQADGLVGMTKVLAREIRDGDLDAAQSAYAPAHRYLKSLAPVARIFATMQARMDPGGAADKTADAASSGFRRLEYGLYADKSTAGLSATADRLAADARELRERIKLLDLEPSLLLDNAAWATRDIAGSAADAEPYSSTDLWDVEAGIDGVRQVVALVQPQLQARQAAALARTAQTFARLDALIATHKAGCGFKRTDELAARDKVALKAEVAALADALSSLRTSLAVD